MKTILWLGPVETANIARAVPQGWTVVTHNHGAGGIGSDAFKAWALSLGEDALTKLAPKATEILLMGFSAAHGALDVLLGQTAQAKDERVRGLIACDAYYSAFGVTTAKQGYLAWCRWALETNRPAWFTTSTHHPVQHPSASVSIVPLVDALGLESVQTPAGMPATVETKGRGEIRWMQYGDRLTHKQHAVELAARMLEVGPFFGASGKGPSAMAKTLPSEVQKPAPPEEPIPPQAPAPPPSTTTPSNPALGALALMGAVGLGAWAIARRR